MTGPAPILYTLPNLTTAGSGRALFEIARRLDRARFRAVLCLASRGGALESAFEEAGIPVLEGGVTVAGAPRLGLPARARAAARRLRGAAPRGALWHSFHYLDDYSEPLVARFAGARAFLYTKKNMSWNRRSWQLRTLGATRVVAQNRDMMERFFGGAWRRRTRLIPRGVDTARFEPPPTPRGGDGELAVGCVAHVVPVKGHPTLLDAVARLVGESPASKVRLELAGRRLDEAYARALDRQIERLGLGEVVRWPGAVEDVPSLLRGLDVFVLPTRMEGCPVALLEAMASGLPVIATDVPGARDVVEHGRSGLLVPPEDPAALAAALARLAASPEERRRLGAAARRRVLEHYSIEREVADHENLYAEVLGL